MAKPNPKFEALNSPYIFPIIERKLAKLQAEHPDQKVLNLGVGDVGLPLSPSIAEEIHRAVDEMTTKPIGYGPCEGYAFLREKICEEEYGRYGFEPDEIFISSGTNPDASAIHDLFDPNSVVAMVDPTYPVYRDACLIAGKKIVYLETGEQSGFLPSPPSEPVDLVYLCTPSNPTGVALSRECLQGWIDWAKETGAVLLIDNVYSAFVESEDVPKSIYELKGGSEVAIEMRSFSKSAGFTGLRCSYLVVPKTLQVAKLHELWAKRVDITTNGIAYPIQRGAMAAFRNEELEAQIANYKKSSAILRKALDELGQIHFGGVDSPYIFWKAPDGMSSWEFFDELLKRSSILAIPGSGFGSCGEGFVRLSCFISNALAQESAHALHHHFISA